MSNGVLLAVISCPRDNSLVARHWDFFLRAKADEIVGAVTNDSKCEWPEPIRTLNTGVVGTKPLGKVGVIWSLCQQELDIISTFLNTTSYRSLAVLEADNLVLKPFPKHPEGCLLLCPILPNLQPQLFSTPIYCSTPRWYDRDSAAHVLHHGEQLLASGTDEHKCSDRFVAAAAFRARVRIMNYGFSSYPMLGPGN